MQAADLPYSSSPLLGTDINRWTINFSIDSTTAKKLTEDSAATFTIQLAAAKTTAGNTDANQGAWPSFPVRVSLRIYVPHC